MEINREIEDLDATMCRDLIGGLVSLSILVLLGVLLIMSYVNADTWTVALANETMPLISEHYQPILYLTCNGFSDAPYHLPTCGPEYLISGVACKYRNKVSFQNTNVTKIIDYPNNVVLSTCENARVLLYFHGNYLDVLSNAGWKVVTFKAPIINDI